MYESIKYEDLKQLPDDQKKEALQELMTTYGSNSAIAEAVGGVPVAISNMYKKYVEGKSVGRTKGSKNATEAIQEESLNNVTEIKPKRKYTKKTDKVVEQIQEPLQEEIIRTPIKLSELTSLSFTTLLLGDFTGEEIKSRVSGIINSLLNDKKYTINVRIDEL